MYCILYKLIVDPKSGKQVMLPYIEGFGCMELL